MSKTNQDFSNVTRLLKTELSIFADKCASAVKDGTNIAGDQIKETVSEFVKPSSIFAEKFASALKDGANIVGEQIMAAGMDFVQKVMSSGKSNNQGDN